MAKGKQIGNEKRAAIWVLYKEGYSEREISKKDSVSPKGVHITIIRKRETGELSDRRRSGRPKATTSAEDRFIVTTSKCNRRLTAPEITQINEIRQKKVSVTTVKTRLLTAGLKDCVAMKKPLLRPMHKQNDLLGHENMKAADVNSRLEKRKSKFAIFGSMRIFVRRRSRERVDEQCIVPTVKHRGGSVMVWGCFTGETVGDLVKIEDTMKKEEYFKILQDNALPSRSRIVGQNLIFQRSQVRQRPQTFF